MDVDWLFDSELRSPRPESLILEGTLSGVLAIEMALKVAKVSGPKTHF